jgi:KipI family sensor histidine kinase inhibitor
MSSPKIYPLGDQALVCESAPPATLECQMRAWHVARVATDWAHVLDVVPGMNNVTLVFDPLEADPDALAAQLREAWAKAPVDTAEHRVVEIPVRYGGEFGPDLDAVAQHTGLGTREVVERHAAGDYIVFFLGFQPGFAYMGGLDASLFTPRRSEPRLAVPPGSVGIGGEQTGIYPAASPGGWQLIGRTDTVLFDPTRTPSTALLPGDRVRFTIAEVVA